VKRLITMSMMTGVLSLIGCSKERDEQVVQQARNTPPTPPNCPQLPELENITLKDGSLADVRIIRDGAATFYVPFDWFAWEARASGKPEEYWKRFQSGVVGKYDIEPIECPGVVHEREFGYTTPLISIKNAETGHGIPPNFSKESEINSVSFGRIYPHRPGFKKKLDENRIDEDIEPFGLGYEAFIRVGSNHYARYRAFDVGNADRWAGPEWEAFRSETLSSRDWKLKRDSVRELFNWLKIPPRDRDNQRVFRLRANDI